MYWATIYWTFMSFIVDILSVTLLSLSCGSKSRESPCDARSWEDERRLLDLVLAPTNSEDFQVEIVLESTNTTFESTSDLLESTSKR